MEIACERMDENKLARIVYKKTSKKTPKTLVRIMDIDIDKDKKKKKKFMTVRPSWNCVCVIYTKNPLTFVEQICKEKSFGHLTNKRYQCLSDYIKAI